MKIPNNQTTRFGNMTDNKLIDIMKDCHTAVYVVECYGASDLHNFLGARMELEKRGYTITDLKSNNRLYIRKPRH